MWAKIWRNTLFHFLIIVFYSCLFVCYQWDVLSLAATVVEGEACFPCCCLFQSKSLLLDAQLRQRPVTGTGLAACTCAAGGARLTCSPNGEVIGGVLGGFLALT